MFSRQFSNFSILTATALFLISQVGCSVLGDVVIPPHPKSAATDPELICLILKPPKEEEVRPPDGFLPLVVPGVATAVAVIGGVLIDQAGKAIKTEGERYKASYSARTTDFLLKATKPGARPTLNIKSITLVRYYGKDTPMNWGCKDPPSGDYKALTFEAEFLTFLPKYPLPKEKEKNQDQLQDHGLLQLQATGLSLARTKAKVPSPRWFLPWSWWMFFDRSAQKIDINANVAMTVMAQEKKDSEIKPVDLMRVDLPLGKRNLDDKTDWKVDHIASGWIAAPQFDTSGLAAGQLFAPVTITVTITETDELGDPIGEASKKVSENKEKILAELLKALGLKTDEKK